MVPIQSVTVPQNKETCFSSVIQLLACSWHARSRAFSTRVLPVEIISTVIHFASYSSQDPLTQSILISHVCKQWRQISLSMPSLWTSITLSLPLSQSKLARTAACIIRSRNHPLDIYMDFRDPSWDWDETSHTFDSKAMDDIMHTLVPQASRWQSVELLTDTWAPIFTFLSCTVACGSASLLQTIRLARCNEYFVVHGETFKPADLSSPVAWFMGGAGLRHLRHVSLSGVHVDWAHSGLAGLRELELKYHARDVMPSLSEFRRILCANPGLERLVILGWGPQMDRPLEDEHEDIGSNSITFPQLKAFEIGFVDIGYTIGLLSLLAMPNIQVLAVEDVAFGIQFSERQDCSRLCDHLVKMNAAKRIPISSLRELSLRSVHADGTSVCNLLGQSSALVSLCLDRVDAATILATCSALHACDRVEALTLKDIDPKVMAIVLGTRSFPPRIRIFIDVDEVDEGEEFPGDS